MKKLAKLAFAGILAAATMMGSFPTGVQAAQAATAAATDKITVTVNGQAVTFADKDAQPKIADNRVYVPIKEIADALNWKTAFSNQGFVLTLREELPAEAEQRGEVGNAIRTAIVNYSGGDTKAKIFIAPTYDKPTLILPIAAPMDITAKNATIFADELAKCLDVTLDWNAATRTLTFSGEPKQEPTEPPIDTDSFDYWLTHLDEFKKEVFRLINVARADEGLDPFEWGDEKLTAFADIRAEEASIKYQGHIRPNGEKVTTENISGGYGRPRDVINGWLHSPGHRAAMLNPINGGRFRFGGHISIGVSRSKNPKADGVYCVIEFERYDSGAYVSKK